MVGALLASLVFVVAAASRPASAATLTVCASGCAFADFQLALNAAQPGDTILIYSTGLGQTTPPVQTGVLVTPPAGGFNNTSTVTVTIGGQNADVVASIASPNFAGLYQTAVKVPSGVSGNVPLILKAGTTSSNTVTLPVQ